MTVKQINELAQAAIEAEAKFENRRPGGFKHAFLYEAHLKAQRLFQKHATPKAIHDALKREQAIVDFIGLEKTLDKSFQHFEGCDFYTLGYSDVLIIYAAIHALKTPAPVPPIATT